MFEGIKIFHHLVALQDGPKVENLPLGQRPTLNSHLKKMTVILRGMGLTRRIEDTSIINLFLSDKASRALIEE